MFWANGWNIPIFIYTVFSGTHVQVRRVEGFSRLMAQTTRTRARMCLLGFVDITPHLGGQIPKTPNFGGREEAFNSSQTHEIEKHAYYPKCFTDSNQTAQWWRPPNALRGWSQHTQNDSKIADGRHLGKSKNRHISATVGSIVTKFGKVTQLDPLYHSELQRPWSLFVRSWISRQICYSVLAADLLYFCFWLSCCVIWAVLWLCFQVPNDYLIANLWSVYRIFSYLRKLRKLGHSSHTCWLIYALDVSCSFSETFAV